LPSSSDELTTKASGCFAASSLIDFEYSLSVIALVGWRSFAGLSRVDWGKNGGIYMYVLRLPSNLFGFVRDLISAGSIHNVYYYYSKYHKHCHLNYFFGIVVHSGGKMVGYVGNAPTQ